MGNRTHRIRSERRSARRWARLRRCAVAVGVLASLTAFAAAAGANATKHSRTTKHSRRHSRRARTTTVVEKAVTAPGVYAVKIVVASRTIRANHVEVIIGAERRPATIDRDHRVRINLRLTIAGRSLMVRAVGRRARPLLRVALRRVLKQTSKPHATAPTTTTSSATTTTTTTTAPASTTTATTAPSAPPPAQAPNPYTNLIWQDNFQQDFAAANASNGASQEPLGDASSAWGLDSWGDCGGSQSTSPTSGSAATSAAFLTSGGLTLPAVSNGSSWYAAQVDSGSGSNPITVNVGETVEASMTLPVGQGLCPAFWLVSKGGPSGEIDIVEAPAFVGPQFPSTPPYSIFTLHANQVQQFEVSATPAGWNAAGPNVYGVIWGTSSITWTVNGVAYATSTPANLADPALWSNLTSGSYSIIFDEAVGGWPGSVSPETFTGQPFEVQWVKVFN
jgi:beta-glucanase (GH16 family)